MSTSVEHTEQDQDVEVEDVELDQDVEDVEDQVEDEDEGEGMEERVEAMAQAFTVRLLAAVLVVRKSTTTACVPVRAVITGSPYVWARLWAPVASRLGEHSEERSTIAAGLSQARAAELAKLTDPVAIATKKAGYAEADKAARKEQFSQLGNIGIGVGIAAFLGIPMAWQFIGPWVSTIAWSCIGLWCVAAMAHAPKARTAPKPSPRPIVTTASGTGTTATTAPAPARAETRPTTLSPAELITALERMVALRAMSDGGLGKVHLAEALVSFQRSGLYPGMKTRDFSPIVKATGLPTDEGVRVGKKVTTGLTFKLLQAHLGRPPQAPAQQAPAASPATAV
ncbi:hypothetical protein F4556_007596 [Kitasatospora gansuensis]|uniref:Uncharacterized protein n=1 Tax=Kitasatospora gansuensis TaxID=258050 RepID=A0A7W7WLL6_9ACTN|nr:hypothetical protein [Kitasatospora gansuensis]MBB4951942.1 hypothetical protein [Kitasatospora gansuensis]